MLITIYPYLSFPFSEKVLKSISKRKYKFLAKSNLLYTNQFGFRTYKSTIGAVSMLVGDIVEAFEDGSCVTHCDLSNAFDYVNHHRLEGLFGLWSRLHILAPPIHHVHQRSYYYLLPDTSVLYASDTSLMCVLTENQIF